MIFFKKLLMTNKENLRVLNKKICEFIKINFFSPFKLEGKETSLNKYANACNLSSSTISKINEAEGYNIPVSTIFAICNTEKISLKKFFTDFETSLKNK